MRSPAWRRRRPGSHPRDDSAPPRGGQRWSGRGRAARGAADAPRPERRTAGRPSGWRSGPASGPWQRKGDHCREDASPPGRADKWIKWIPAVVLYLSWVKSPWGLSLWLIFFLWPVILFHYKSARSCVSELTASHEGRQEPTQEVCIVPRCNSRTLWCMQPVLRKPTASLPSKVSSTKVSFHTAFI